MYNEGEDVEKILRQDSIDKRRTGRGAFHMKGKGVKHGISGVRFPSDYLTATQKRKLNGEVKVSNMYDNLNNVPSLDELKAMKEDEARAVLKNIKSRFSQTEIAKHWKLKSSSTVNYWYKKFGLVESVDKTDVVKIERVDRKGGRVVEEPIGVHDLNKLYKQMQNELANIVEVKNVMANNNEGFTININGSYEQADMVDRVTNILLSTVKDKKYAIKLEIKEL